MRFNIIPQFSDFIIMEGGVKETLEQKAWREHLLGQFNKMMETMMERMDRLEVSIHNEDHDGSETSNSNRRNPNRVDNNLGSIKMKIPSFQGKNDSEAYLEWNQRWKTFLRSTIIQKIKR